MNAFALTPLDAWFFRDGRPYNKKETNQADVASVFPPPARTFSGAFRAAFARAHGWNGQGSWPHTLNNLLGSGPDELGPLQFTGPFLIKQDQALWPMPRHLLGRRKPATPLRVTSQSSESSADDTDGKWKPVAFLRPDQNNFLTDVGQINLPIVALPQNENSNGLKLAESAWITSEALATILKGDLPPVSGIFSPGDLWCLEPRVGLHRDETRRVTGEGDLYSPAYVRLMRDVALGVAINGLPSDSNGEVPALFPLGGESRLAQCEPWAGDPVPARLPAESFPPDDSGRVRFTVILLTPGCFKEWDLPGAEIISACVGKPQFIGGWDSLKREPLPLEPFAPAGSVWFCTADAADFPALHARHGQWIGLHAAHGFGQIVIGRWSSFA